MKTNELIKARRQELGLTVREVADRVGVGPITVSRWESGNIANMRRDKISKLAKVLDLDPDVLTGYGHAYGPKAVNIHGSIFSERGTPDIIGCINGTMVAFECKRDDSEDLRKIQKWRLSEWLTAGAVVGGVPDLEHVKWILWIMGVV